MQTNTRVHNTDQKEGNAMNSNLNDGSSHKEKQMNAITKTVLAAVLVALGLALMASAAEPPKPATPSDLDKLVGQPADLSPWAYAWRADRQVQEKAEAYFIPRRLANLERIYRKADTEPTIHIQKGKDQWVKLDGVFWFVVNNEGPMTPPPKGVLHAGLLWETHVLWNRIELHWPKDKGPVPNPDAVEVRFHPNAAWFGVEWDRVAGKPEVSADGLIWTYSVKTAVVPKDLRSRGPGLLPAGMVVVYVDPQGAPASGRYAVPEIRVVGLKDWKRMDIEIEWGFQAGTEKSDYSGRIEGYLGIGGNVAPLAGDAQTRVTESGSWTSASASGGRRGIKCSVLYLPWGIKEPPLNPRPLSKEPRDRELQTAVTVWTKAGNFTFLPEDLEEGPILAPEYGFYVTKAGGGKAAREFAAELAAKGLKGIRQRTREHREATTEEAIREITMTKAPAGVTELPPMKEVEEPAMQVRTPEEWWNKAWRKGVYQLKKGPGSYWFGKEAACPIQAMDLVGLHEKAAGPKHLESWLNVPGIKVESDCLDGDGNFHGFGQAWDSVHANCTGYFLSIMGAHYFLSGDKEWFQKHQARMQKAADWLIRQRTEYMKEVPNRGQLRSAGLQPPASNSESWGQNAWRFFYMNDRWSCDGILSFGSALSDFDPQKGKAYIEEARRYQEDIRKSVEQTIALTPVQKVLDGTYRSYSPGCCYYRRRFESWGWKGVRYGYEDQWHLTGLQGSQTLGSLRDPRHEGHLEVFQDRFYHVLFPLDRDGRLFVRREKKGLSAEENWFWGGISVQPGWFWLSDDELYRDDVSNFLRLLVDTYWNATQPGDGEYFLQEVGVDSHWKIFDHNSNSMGWFIRNFRNLLVMEDLDEEPWRLWLARATPRHWLEQGKKISVKNAPTYFGPLAYEIVSDVDNGKISATVEMPARKAPKEVVLRFRHPKAAPIKAVTVNGKPWTEFNKDKETITLPRGLTGTVTVTAQY
jgi:hypothetical protein